MSEVQEIYIRRPDDFHVHLRSASFFGSFNWFQAIVGLTAWQFGRALVMPNTDPPILTADDAVKYKREIVFEVFEEMERVGMVLSIHGKAAGEDIFCLDREKAFLPTLEAISRSFAGLKIVLEHITTADAFFMVLGLPKNVAATITAHHLFLTLDDIIGGKLSPHNFCKPVAKYPKDRDILRRAATSGNPKLFFGSDSAPNLRLKKESAEGDAGIFSVVASPLLAEFFEEHGSLDKLNDFTSVFGAQHYGLSLNEGEVRMVKNEWVVPDEYYGIVPFMAGRKMTWQVQAP